MRTCECGCGQIPPIATRNRLDLGHVKGEPVRFVHGHNARGERHPRWNGGRTIRPNGYAYVSNPGHPKADKIGYVTEHVMVAERVLKRLLPGGAEVHHVNRVRDDNRPQNLVICQDRAYHMLLHQRMRALRACGHADWLKCRFCGRYDAPDQMYVSPSGRGHHRDCHNRQKREQRALMEVRS